MTLLHRRSDLINYLEEKNIYSVLYFIFLLIFFVSPSLRAHCNFFYAIIIPIYLISLKKCKLRVLLGSRIWLFTMVLLVYLMLTMLWQKNTGSKDPVYFIRKGVYLFVFFSLTMEIVLRDQRFMGKLFSFLAWIGAITAIASTVWFYTFVAVPPARLEYIADQLRNSVQGGIVYGMIVLIIYFYIIKKEVYRPRRLFYGLLGIIISVSVLLTQSRGPVGNLLIAFLIGGLLTRDKKLLIALVLVIVLGAVLFLRVEPIQKAVTKRGLSYRLELTQKTIAMTKDDLLFGKGLTTDQRIKADDGTLLYHPHNIYLGMILYGGLTGLLIFLLLLAAAFRESLLIFFQDKDITLFMLVLFAALNIITSMDKIITHPGPFWIYFWLPLALVAGVSAQKSGEALSLNCLPGDNI